VCFKFVNVVVLYSIMYLSCLYFILDEKTMIVIRRDGTNDSYDDHAVMMIITQNVRGVDK